MKEDGKVVQEETIYHMVKGLVEEILEKNDKLTNAEVLNYVKLQCDNYRVPLYDLRKVWFKILKELKA